MREILFRGKRVDNGEWVEGDLLQEDGCANIVTEWFCGINEIYCTAFEVDTETVGQYTGLTDKDGKKLFEGDIVKVTAESGKKKYQGEIKYSGSGFYLIEKGIGYLIDVDCIACNVIVDIIGNIHDTQELLEDKNNE